MTRGRAQSLRAPRATAEQVAERTAREAGLVRKKWRVVAGPPGTRATFTTVESPESLKRLGLEG